MTLAHGFTVATALLSNQLASTDVVEIHIDEVGIAMPIPPVVPDGTGFGCSIAAWSGQVLIGVDGRRDGPRYPGMVACYRRTESEWQCREILRSPESAAGDEFGAALAIGRRQILVGSPGAADQRGLAWCFHWSPPEGWIAAKALRPRGTDPGDRFGETLALSQDWAVVGGPRADIAGVIDAGRVEVFSLSSNPPVATMGLAAVEPRMGGRFGSSLAIGPSLAVGEIGGSPIGPDAIEVDRAGVVHRFTPTPPFDRRSSVTRATPGRRDRTGTSLGFCKRRLVIGSPRATTEVGRSGVVTVVAEDGDDRVGEYLDPRCSDGGLGSSLVAMAPVIAFSIPGRRDQDGRVDGCVRIGVLHRDGFEPRLDVVGFQSDGAELVLAADPIEHRLVIGMPGWEEDGPRTGRAWTIDLELVDTTSRVNPLIEDRTDR